MLVTLRADTQRRGFPTRHSAPSVGVMAARLARRGRVFSRAAGGGPAALGARCQESLSLGRGAGGWPVDLDVALARIFTRDESSLSGGFGGAGGYEYGAAAGGGGGGGGGGGAGGGGGGSPWRSLWGANAELRTDARRALKALGRRRAAPAPLSVSGSAVLDESGELVAAAAAALRVSTGGGGRSGVGAKVQVNNRGFCNVSLQVRSARSTRLGLLGLYPLLRLAWDAASAARERRRQRRAAAAAAEGRRQRRRAAREAAAAVARGDGGGGAQQ